MDTIEEIFVLWFSMRLKELRNNEGMTQKEFADACGIGSATYERHEQGKFCPRMSTCILIANQLGISLSELLEGFEVNENNT